MKVSAIVPAYNEASRIGAVLKPLVSSSSVDEVIVVDDGSDDGTAEVAQDFPVQVVTLAENCGKAKALDEGVVRARNDVLLFLDADLVGLTEEHVDKFVHAYEESGVDMAVGVFANGRKNTDFAQKFNPYASGQRMLTKKLWERAKANVHEMNYGIEFALSKLAVKEGWSKEKVKLEGVTHVLKEEKRGFSNGMRERLKMYGDMIKWLFKKI
ncbi:MAG TPA: glycosyltransferase family 2 protein [Candidatus Acetothermia bacterium]|nr:glycosyltransferase family 2 protein [Candidatus Acetothermia bacterium]